LLRHFSCPVFPRLSSLGLAGRDRHEPWQQALVTVMQPTVASVQALVRTASTGVLCPESLRRPYGGAGRPWLCAPAVSAATERGGCRGTERAGSPDGEPAYTCLQGARVIVPCRAICAMGSPNGVPAYHYVCRAPARQPARELSPARWILPTESLLWQGARAPTLPWSPCPPAR